MLPSSYRLPIANSSHIQITIHYLYPRTSIQSGSSNKQLISSNSSQQSLSPDYAYPMIILLQTCDNPIAYTHVHMFILNTPIIVN